MSHYDGHHARRTWTLAAHRVEDLMRRSRGYNAAVVPFEYRIQPVSNEKVADCASQMMELLRAIAIIRFMLVPSMSNNIQLVLLQALVGSGQTEKVSSAGGRILYKQDLCCKTALRQTIKRKKALL